MDNDKTSTHLQKPMILDCTLRDGGYYTNWFFNDDLVRRIIRRLDDCHIDYIELGYRSLSPDDKFGPFRYCREDFIKGFAEVNHARLAIMLDLKEIGNTNDLKDHFPPEHQSPISLVRLSGYHRHIDKVNSVCRFLKEQGYKTSFNFMGVSLLNEEEIVSGLSILNKDLLDYVYFSDSFGHITPDQIPFYIRLFHHEFGFTLGFHGHNNQGLALQNTLTALSSGLELADSTLFGMGRGAGNTKTEELLLRLAETDSEMNHLTILMCDLENDFVALKKQYEWGQSFAYMLSGLLNIHPSYCQYLKNDYRLGESEISRLLLHIQEQDKSRFNPDTISLLLKQD